MLGFSGLKDLIRRARPENDFAAGLRGFSFPSGHTSHSLLVYGLLGYLAFKYLPHPWGVVVAGLAGGFIFLVGLSRVYLGAHFPTDVLGAWLLAGGALWLIIRLSGI
jgi:undecaprenyl-diphosphatase